MSVSIVIDDLHTAEKWIKEDTPPAIRAALLATQPSSGVKTKSMQLVIEDEHGGHMSILLDHMQGRVTMQINDDDPLYLTLHDTVRISAFWVDAERRIRG